tara:strand:+ start:1620 stop:2036 length:417 start_codon:yes stop_codon:yes gene_type:complete
MAVFRGEEGSVKFINGSGTAETIVSTTGWTLDTSKETLDVTAHGNTFRAFAGGLISGSGTVDFIYTAASGNETENLIDDILTAEDAGDAQFELFLDTSGSKKVSFSGIVTGTSLSATVGDLETVSVSFVTNGTITNAV